MWLPPLTPFTKDKAKAEYTLVGQAYGWIPLFPPRGEGDTVQYSTVLYPIQYRAGPPAEGGTGGIQDCFFWRDIEKIDQSAYRFSEFPLHCSFVLFVCILYFREVLWLCGRVFPTRTEDISVRYWQMLFQYRDIDSQNSSVRYRKKSGNVSDLP